MPNITCPKCRYVRQEADRHVHAGVCPSCGIAYQKYLDRLHAPAPPPPVVTVYPTRAALWRARLLAVPAGVPPAVLVGRAGVWCALALWAVYFTVHGISWEAVGGSFLHSVILPFHEFGHLLFAPFGRFMGIFGGSLFQVLMPLALGLAFVFRQHDNFAASAMLWWTGQSLVDLAPYIADAVDRGMPLVGGAGTESHDWGNLLTMTHMLEHAQAIARLCFGAGVLAMAAALAWGAVLLRAQHGARHQKE